MEYLIKIPYIISRFALALTEKKNYLLALQINICGSLQDL